MGRMGGSYTESYTVGDGWGEWGVGIPKVTLWGTGGGVGYSESYTMTTRMTLNQPASLLPRLK